MDFGSPGRAGKLTGSEHEATKKETLRLRVSFNLSTNGRLLAVLGESKMSSDDMCKNIAHHHIMLRQDRIV